MDKKHVHIEINRAVHDLYSVLQGSSHRTVYLGGQDVLGSQEGYQ
jgi:hypothetical protein